MDELKQLSEDLAKGIADVRAIGETMDRRLSDGLSNVVKKDELEKALADSKRLADQVEEVERKFLAQSARQIVTDPAAARGSRLAQERESLGQCLLGATPAQEMYRTLGMATDNSTGHFIIMPPTMADGILEILRDFSAFEQVADVETIPGVTWERLKQTGGGSARRGSERGTRTETGTPTFGKDVIETGQYEAYPALTQQQLALTTAVDLASFVERDQDFEIQELVEADYISGTGVGGYPKGLTANATLQAAAQVTGSANSLGTSYDPLRKMTGDVHENFLPNARWMMKRSTEVLLSLLKDGDGKYLWQESIAQGQPNTLFGYPISYNAYMPAVSAYATNPYCVAFGDFRQYKVIRSRFMLMIRDEITSKGNVLFYKEIHKGGDIRRTQAFSLLKIAAS